MTEFKPFGTQFQQVDRGTNEIVKALKNINETLKEITDSLSLLSNCVSKSTYKGYPIYHFKCETWGDS